MNPAELIKFHRKAKGWTMRELARQSGVSVAYIAKIEKGEGNPTISIMQPILEAMGLTLTLAATNDSGEEFPQAKPLNVANRFQALIDLSTPATLEALATAFTAVAEAHSGLTGAMIGSLGKELLFASYEKSAGVRQ